MANNREAMVNPRPIIRHGHLKLIVVGERGCGKTTFIERFARRMGNVLLTDDDLFPNAIDYSTIDFLDVKRLVIIVEIVGVAEQLVNQVTRDHRDANGIIFMYAIDDPTGFEAMPRKWIQNMENNGCKTNQATILVGNKKDLREDQQLMERLDLDNQFPVTRQQGEDLKDVRALQNFFEISSTDENDPDIHDAYYFILNKAYQHWREL